MKFAAVLEAAGKTATGLEVPPEVLDALAAGKRPKVCVTLNGPSGATRSPSTARKRRRPGPAGWALW